MPRGKLMLINETTATIIIGWSWMFHVDILWRTRMLVCRI